jgi:DNA-binding NarL/FixJ family response regulator
MMAHKILIADDDRAFVELVTTRLRADGFDVIAAFDATQAMMLAVKQRPDLIVLDIRMPGGNGIDTLKKLKASTRTMMAEVVVVSASEDPNIVETARAAGAAAFVPKPAKYQTVSAAVRKALGLEQQDGADTN